jgi:hypothetical protein
MLSRAELIAEGVQKCQAATAAAVELKGHPDPAVQELAKAIHFLAFGVQEIAQALTEQGRVDNLPIQLRQQ